MKNELGLLLIPAGFVLILVSVAALFLSI